MGGGKSTTRQPYSGVIAPEQLQQTSPNLMKPFQEFMPAEYFGNGPIYDPSGILAAYAAHMPAFLDASRTTNPNPQPTTPVAPAAPQKLMPWWTKQPTYGMGINQEVNRKIMNGEAY